MATRTLRKRKAPVQKPTKRQRISPPEPKTVKAKKEKYPVRCFIKNMPNEIMGLIFGCLNLSDLANMLCVSKWVNVHFPILFFKILMYSLHLKVRCCTDNSNLYWKALKNS